MLSEVGSNVWIGGGYEARVIENHLYGHVAEDGTILSVALNTLPLASFNLVR